MTTQKQPQAGEWWQHKNSSDRAYFIGRTPDGEMVFQCEGDGVETGDLDWSDWQHLPDCDSWTWQPEVFPQYWTKSGFSGEKVAFVELVADSEWIVVYKDGSRSPIQKGLFSSRDRKQLTKEQAEAMLDKPQESPPQPSPKRVPVRLWRQYCTGNVIATIDRIDDPDPIDLSEEADQIKHDANGFYVEVQQ